MRNNTALPTGIMTISVAFIFENRIYLKYEFRFIE